VLWMLRLVVCGGGGGGLPTLGGGVGKHFPALGKGVKRGWGGGWGAIKGRKTEFFLPKTESRKNEIASMNGGRCV